jgi:hypothetical protein
MSYTSTPELIKESKKRDILQIALEQHPSFLVQRCIFEDIHLTIEEVDYYLGAKEVMGEQVDRVWLLKKLSEGYVLDAPYHLIKLILKQ